MYSYNSGNSPSVNYGVDIYGNRIEYAAAMGMHDASPPPSSYAPVQYIGGVMQEDYSSSSQQSHPPVPNNHYMQQGISFGHPYNTMTAEIPPLSAHDRYSSDWQLGDQAGLYASQRASYDHGHHRLPSQSPTHHGGGYASQHVAGATHQVPVYPGPLTKCAWDGGSCGVPLDDTSPAGIARHLRSFHFRGNWQARSRGRCRWGPGCRGDEMNFESMGKHVAQVHLGTTKKQCADCGGIFARNDALLRHQREHCGLNPSVADAAFGH